MVDRIPNIEKLDFKFDIARLRLWLEEQVLPLPPSTMGPHMSGWSILSADGTTAEGWAPFDAKKPVSVEFNTVEEIAAWKREVGLPPLSECIRPTPICTGPMFELVMKLRQMRLFPFRARLIKLSPGCETSVHQDMPSHLYGVRLHIPIVTNPKAGFEYEISAEQMELHHFPADGSGYLVWTNRRHSAHNRGDAARYHFVADVFDFFGVSQFHRISTPQMRELRFPESALLPDLRPEI